LLPSRHDDARAVHVQRVHRRRGAAAVDPGREESARAVGDDVLLVLVADGAAEWKSAHRKAGPWLPIGGKAGEVEIVVARPRIGPYTPAAAGSVLDETAAELLARERSDRLAEPWPPQGRRPVGEQ